MNMAIWIVLPILTLLMFDLGLTLKFEDFGKVFRSPWPIAIALVGQLILLPLIALGLAWAFKLPPVFFIGLVLIACCPGGSSSNVFSKLAGGDVALSVTLTALSSVITLFTIPVIMSLATTMVGQSVGITLPVGNLIKQNLLLMLVPVLLGIGMHYAWPNAAEKTDKVLGKLAFPLLLVLITVFYIQHHKTIIDNIGILGVCVTALILVAIGCSSLLSRLVKTGDKQRRTVVIEVGMQNAAQAIAIASSPFIFANEEMAIPAILYSLMMNIVLLIYVGVLRKRDKRQLAEATEPISQ
ncbi:MAG: bile acid:sodium symporter family protein [Bacteroidales bacterium]|nr:bile acid:sodium symporter family protein [Bacteroidales bacterium]